MSDDKNKNQDQPFNTGEKPEAELLGSVSDYLAEKTRLMDMAAEQERKMEEQYKRLVTVMFTDIKGSTAFYETHGDIEGRMMVE